MPRSTKNGQRPPVGDWATDWDHLDPRWRNDPYPIWDELRSTCPIAHTRRFMGAYLPTRYEDVRAIAYDTERFSSRRGIGRDYPLHPPPPPPPHHPQPPDPNAPQPTLL